MKFIVIVLLFLCTPLAAAQELPESAPSGESRPVKDPGPEEKEAKQDGDGPKEGPDQYNGGPYIISGPPLHEQETGVQEEGKSHEHSHDERDIADLKAQRSVGFWTPWIGASAIISALTSALAAIFLYFTLRATREISKDQNRAYLVLTEAEFAFVGLAHEDMPCNRRDAYQFVGTVKNLGATPTENFHVTYCLKYRNWAESGEKVTFSEYKGTTPRWNGPGPGLDNSFPIAESGMVNFIHETIDSAEPGGQLTLTGEIIFRTVYGETRTQSFHMSLSLDRARIYRSNWKRIYARQEEAPAPVRLRFAVLDE